MKKILCFFSVLLYTAVGFAQLQNSNWIFGQSVRADFDPLPVAFSTITGATGWNALEGCASVSDYFTGDLMFFTDGVRVFQPNGAGYTLITDQLKGDTSSLQNVIIIPRPNRYKSFYIATIFGYSSPEPTKGLCYSEIDFSSGTGVVVSLNIHLTDDFGVPIDENYGNLSETITSAKHVNGQDYWLVSHIGQGPGSANTGKIFSYLVAENGIGTATHGPNSVLSLPLTTPHGRMLKISPNNKRFVFTTTYNGVYYGAFDEITGALAVNGNKLASFPYGAEFSPNSDYVYYTSNAIMNRFHWTTPASVITWPGVTAYGMQLAPDGKIYVGSSGTTIRSLNSPNTGVFTNTTFTFATSGNYDFPQVVHQYEPEIECAPLTLGSETHTANFTYINHNIITTAGNYAFAAPLVDPDIQISMLANDMVVLSANTHIRPKSGAYMAAFKECDIVTKAPEITPQRIPKETAATTSGLRLYPNPAVSGTFIETVDLLMKNVKVSRVTDGRTVFDLQIPETHSYRLDVSMLQKGLYVINVETSDGEILTEKLLKN